MGVSLFHPFLSNGVRVEGNERDSIGMIIFVLVDAGGYAGPPD